MHIAILGLGPSVSQYLEITKRKGGRKAFADETWCINALGGIFDCDRIFHMDDVRIQEIRAAAKPDSNIARMLDWLKTTSTPVVTSRAHPDYPALEEFPLGDVLTRFRYGYMNNTAAYAVAYALWLMHIKHRDKKNQLSLFGMDYTYDNVEHAERGRACVEYWLGVATEMGVHVVMPKTTSLMDAYHTEQGRFYGYDTVDLTLAEQEGCVVAQMTPREQLPTAEEIEAAYDHSAPIQQQHIINRKG